MHVYMLLEKLIDLLHNIMRVYITSNIMRFGGLLLIAALAEQQLPLFQVATSVCTYITVVPYHKLHWVLTIMSTHIRATYVG